VFVCYKYSTQNSWNYGRTDFKQCISCNNRIWLQECHVATGFVVSCVNGFMCKRCVLNGTPCNIMVVRWKKRAERQSNVGHRLYQQCVFNIWSDHNILTIISVFLTNSHSIRLGLKQATIASWQVHSSSLHLIITCLCDISGSQGSECKDYISVTGYYTMVLYKWTNVASIIQGDALPQCRPDDGDSKHLWNVGPPRLHVTISQKAVIFILWSKFTCRNFCKRYRVIK
jgi:hypothetical protein